MKHKKFTKREIRDRTIKNDGKIWTDEEVSSWPLTQILHAWFYVCWYRDNVCGGLFYSHNFFWINTRKFYLKDWYQNIGLHLVTYVHNIMSSMRPWRNKIENKSDSTSNYKVKLFSENILIIEKKWFCWFGFNLWCKLSINPD